MSTTLQSIKFYKSCEGVKYAKALQKETARYNKYKEKVLAA